MKILFPTDLSEESMTSIKKVLPHLVVKDKEVQVQLLHIVEQPVQGATLMVDITKILTQDAKNQFAREEKKIQEEFGIKVDCQVEIGYYGPELKEWVDIEKPDLVVLVSKARHGIMKYLSGQKSLKFIGELSSPLLIIPEELRFEGVKTVGFAIDKGESPTVETMGRIKTISDYYDAKTDLVHISKEEDENDEFYQRISGSQEFGDVALVKKNNVREGIQLWCLQNQIDVLVTVTHDRSAFSRTFSGSVTKDLVKDNLVALLVITQ